MSFQYQRAAGVEGLAATAPCADPVSCAIAGGVMVGMDLFQLFMHQRQNNAFKVAATVKAESFVRSMFGYGAGCTLPPSTPQSTGFCANSVRGMIERCQLTQAQQYLAWLAQQMQQLAQQDPMYFGKWMAEYGNSSISGLQGTIVSFASSCASAGTIPPPTGGTTAPPVSTGISTSTMLLIGGGLLVMMLAMQ